MLISKCDDEVLEEPDSDVRNESRQSHLWLSNAAVPLGCSGSNPIRKSTVGRETDNGANQ
jgi:hypothetical protein